jgi:hypothetical protein
MLTVPMAVPPLADRATARYPPTVTCRPEADAAALGLAPAPTTGVDVASNCGTPSVTSTAPKLAPAIAITKGTRQVIGSVSFSNNYDFTVTITCDLP